MLNEIAEYNQYTGSAESCTRLKMLKNSASLTGLNRPMTIVARHWMFENPKTADIEKARKALEAWTGLSEDSDAEFKILNGWLCRFLGEEKWRSRFYDKKKHNIENPLFNEKLNSGGINDFRLITFDRILADAFSAGPLKNYYLVCRKDFYEENLKYKTSKDGTIKQCNDNVNINSKLKATAYYLLNKDICSETDLLNWGTSSRETLVLYSYNHERLYVKENITENLSRLVMPTVWTDNFDVIPASRFSIRKTKCNDFVFWSDCGSGDKNRYLNFNKKNR